ncbi:MAG: hypothetical protein CO013_04245 [Syntrophobacterales bacterium CG_4_8_14_3_um_filter_58_8]|nr:MAG: hypothetical protein COS57_04810 [Syntrophobacterales bacterium CG03_land_8_20_14_0_80_58_14]PJC74534.1 MAG: hypothetical protein CO013_04245 [Syntrophobacterales bacterium CG_4_8_14_3_um_filter_58_8]
MGLFLLSFFLIYGGFHLYFFLKIRAAAPDLIVSTGDLVDGQGNNLSEAAAQFREIRPRKFRGQHT